MTEHPDIGPELQQLAKTILGLLDPLVEAGAALASRAESGTPGKCTQMWCPVCAAAALASGEHHPLASAIAEHGAALLALIRAVASPDDKTPPSGGVPPEDAQQSSTPSGYQPIPVTIHE